ARELAADPPVLLMDEPFGAVDPVVRERLQNEFLALQKTVRKTILLVTHDLEEAVRLGDRIAVYGAGTIEQFDRPAAVLGAPANAYVASFVGADRGLKRLAVTPVRAADLEPADGTAPEATVPLGSSLREALAALLQQDAGRIGVADPESGRLAGVLTPQGVHRALRRAESAEGGGS
ncbi:ABC transporter ATP-binding protein, partial [Streptomyces toxytricini]